MGLGFQVSGIGFSRFRESRKNQKKIEKESIANSSFAIQNRCKNHKKTRKQTGRSSTSAPVCYFIYEKALRGEEGVPDAWVQGAL